MIILNIHIRVVVIIITNKLNYSIFISTLQMSIYPNVTEQDLINLSRLAEQQKNQRAEKIKSRILKQTHDMKLAESLSPLTKKLEDVNKSTPELGVFVKKSQKNKPQLDIENTHKALPIENEKIQPGVNYDASLENTLSNMKKDFGFLNIEETDDAEIFWNGFSVEKMGGNTLEINKNIYIVSPGIQKVLAETSNIPLKKLNDEDRERFINILESLNFEKYKTKRGEFKSGRYKKPQINFKKHNLAGQRIEKIIIPPIITDIYTRLEILLGLKLSGHTDTLTEASNLIDELYKEGETQNKQQYKNALNKFSNI